MTEGEAEQKIYEVFAEWCEDESKQKQFEIKTLTSEVEDLKATIAKEASDIEALTAKIEEQLGEVYHTEVTLALALALTSF